MKGDLYEKSNVFIYCRVDYVNYNLLRWGGTGDGDLLLDDQLIASWVVISVMEDGEIQPLADTLEWEPGWTRQVYRLFDNGETAIDSYAGNSLEMAEYGDWTAQNQSGSIVFDDETLNFDYMVYWSDNEPWTADFTYSENGHTYTARLVRETNLTAHHEDMIRTWAVRTITDPSPGK